MKRQTLREARLTEKIERQQRIQREHQERQKYMDHLQSICDHGRNLVADQYEHKATQTKLGRAVLQYHTHVEKEEQKKLERISKERMIALKNDDEEAYMKLIDVAKDTRLAQLLKQTGEFLNSLTLAVVDQKNDPVHARYREDDMDHEEVVSSRIESVYRISERRLILTLFGGDLQTVEGKDDYYQVTHRIKEAVAQPSILIGGKLKEYQVYKNHVHQTGKAMLFTAVIYFDRSKGYSGWYHSTTTISMASSLTKWAWAKRSKLSVLSHI